MYRIMVWSQDGKWEQVFADQNFKDVYERYQRYEVRPGFTKHLFVELNATWMWQKQE